MWICGAGVALMLAGEGIAWWSLSAAVSGFGMALLYPNLSAAIADISHPDWRGSAIGIYRFWRDLGYGIGALGLASPHISAARWKPRSGSSRSRCSCRAGYSSCSARRPIRVSDSVSAARRRLASFSFH